MIDVGLAVCIITLVISTIVHWRNNPVENVFYETEDSDV
jgi:hypothetical protein